MNIDFARDIDPVLLAEVSKDFFNPVTLIRADWPTGVVELFTGSGLLEFDGGTFVGSVMDGVIVAEINAPPEQPGLPATEVSLTLYGSYSDLMEHLNPDAAGRRVQMWAGATTEPGGTELIGTPYLFFSGAISGDSLPAPTTGESTGLIIRAKAGTHGRVKGAITHSDEGQQSKHPGDTFFERNARASALRDNTPYW